MQYCHVHRRAFKPGGYSPSVNRFVDDSWIDILQETWKWACIMHRNFPTQVKIEEVRCDVCLLDKRHILLQTLCLIMRHRGRMLNLVR